MVYDRVIQEVCEASQVDFEEGGVDQQTLEEMRRVSHQPFPPCSIDSICQIVRFCRMRCAKAREELLEALVAGVVFVRASGGQGAQPGRSGGQSGVSKVWGIRNAYGGGRRLLSHFIPTHTSVRPDKPLLPARLASALPANHTPSLRVTLELLDLLLCFSPAVSLALSTAADHSLSPTELAAEAVASGGCSFPMGPASTAHSAAPATESNSPSCCDGSFKCTATDTPSPAAARTLAASATY